MTYWKIKAFKELLNLEEKNEQNEKTTISLDYTHYLKKKIKLMEEAYKVGLEDSQEKKGGDSLYGNHLEPRSETGEGRLVESMPVDADTHPGALSTFHAPHCKTVNISLRKQFSEEEIFKLIDEKINTRKGCLNGEDVFSINDLEKLKDKFRTPQGWRRAIEREGLVGTDFVQDTQDAPTAMLTIGNGEHCPFCHDILDDRIEGKEIQPHLFKFHKKEMLKKLFPEDRNCVPEFHEELKNIEIVNEPNFKNAWELLKWYDVEQSVLDLFDYLKDSAGQRGTAEDGGFKHEIDRAKGCGNNYGLWFICGEKGNLCDKCRPQNKDEPKEDEDGTKS